MSVQTKGLFSLWLRDQRLKKALPHLKGKILDYGCGTGELAKFINRNSYFGVDIDQASINIAKKQFPYFKFSIAIPKKQLFDTICLLAVIEHINHPQVFLKKLSNFLKPKGKIVLTTPHPQAKWIHKIGAKIGFFDKTADQEHKDFFDLKKMKQLVSQTELFVSQYQPFLLGLNQLFILKKK